MSVILAVSYRLVTTTGDWGFAHIIMQGVGAYATALIAKQSQPERFPNARQFAAYFGLVPDQHSSGSKVRLGRMTRRGDAYIRSLAVTGAQSVLHHVKADATETDDKRLQRWCRQHGKKGAAIRLANRNLRIAWVVMTTQSEPLVPMEVTLSKHLTLIESLKRA